MTQHTPVMSESEYRENTFFSIFGSVPEPAFESLEEQTEAERRRGRRGDPRSRDCARAPGALDAVCLMYTNSYYLEQACRIQISAQSTGAPLSLPSENVLARTSNQFTSDANKGWLPWQALRRKLDREQPAYRD